jgi:hypothetical protein
LQTIIEWKTAICCSKISISLWCIPTDMGKSRLVSSRHESKRFLFFLSILFNKITKKQNKKPGDNDPVDVCEVSVNCSNTKTGDVRQVKVLGTYAMIDEGETGFYYFFSVFFFFFFLALLFMLFYLMCCCFTLYLIYLF